jgi:nucleoside-diphosphate-sugar epimerase
MVSDYWKSKRVTLLGGASLIGTHLADALVQRNVRHLEIVDDFSSGKLSNVEHLEKEGVRIYIRDLRNYHEAVYAALNQDIVFHLAAQHGGRGYVASHKTELYDNLSLDTTIFRACADVGVEKVIFSSSACAYPIDLQTNSEDVVYLSEDMIDYNDMRQADGAYGTEKLVGEQILDAYIERGRFQGCSTRSFTVYGPLMNESHAIAAMIAKTMIRQDPFEVWGDGYQIRNWTYVEDNVQGAILAAENLDRGAINIGIEDRLTPSNALFEIWEYMGWQPKTVNKLLDKPVGPRNRVADSAKLKALGWTPKYSFREGLEKTINWYTSTHSVEELMETLDRKLTER